jgi:hypothetical protein
MTESLITPKETWRRALMLEQTHHSMCATVPLGHNSCHGRALPAAVRMASLDCRQSLQRADGEDPAVLRWLYILR